MDNNIKEIVRSLLHDIETDATDQHYMVAINYYNNYGIIPDINYIIGSVMQYNDIMRYVDPVGGDDHGNVPELGQVNQGDIPNLVEENNSDGDIPELERVNQGDILLQYHVIAEQSPNLMDENNSDGDDSDDEYQNLHSGDDEQNSEQINGHMIDVKKVIKDVNIIPLAMFKNITNQNSNEYCLICYDQFVATDIIRILPCDHNLHRRCIDDHLKQNSHLCPYCKGPAGEYILANL